MHQIDYELGLASEEEEWDNAEGRGKAQVARAGCMTGCRLKHLFSKAKRKTCDRACDAKYQSKIAAIDSAYDWVEPDLTDTAISIGRPNLQTPSNGGNGATEKKEGLGTGAMIGIGMGVLALIMIGGFMIMRKK